MTHAPPIAADGADQALRPRARRRGAVARRRSAARCSASSARTAPARRPRSACSSACCARRGGSAAIFGHDTWRDGVAARACLGSLPGDFAFDDHATGAELLDLLAALRGAGDRAYARSLADRFDADLHRPFGELSRGNRQKLGLIQAVVHRPPLVVMDEPTSGLDPLVQEEFAALVRELRDDGTTVFLSSHNLPEVEQLCSRVGILREGRLDRGRADRRRSPAAPCDACA